MQKLYITIIYITIYGFLPAFAGEIRGTVVSKDKPVSFASVVVMNTTIGTQANEEGKFIITNAPNGQQTIQVSSVGYKTRTINVNVSAEKSNNLLIEIEEENAQLNEVVVTGTMKETTINESPAPIQILNPTFFRKNPTPNLFESLSMVNGVRPQLNCNVCSTGDIHINGMEGPYTMVLIDGMPIVSALSTVYGLSGIPNSMVERIEVMKGPASTLYGSEAVGGLINVITKNPGKAPKFNFDWNTTSYLENNFDASVKAKIGNANALFSGNYFMFGNRVDFNQDNFTDVTLQNRVSIFNKWTFQRPQNRAFNLAARYVYEDRFGGEMQWKRNNRGGNEVYGESIFTKRWELLGNYQLPIANEKVIFNFSVNQHDQNSVYGITRYLAVQRIAFGQLLWDKKLAKNHDALFGATIRNTYYDDNTVITQTTDLKNTPDRIWLPGIFIQDEITAGSKNKVLLGLRYDYNSKHGGLFSPRLNWKFSPDKDNIFRFSVGNGYRVVNLFSEDHAALTGSRKVVIKNALKPERSYNANLDYQKFITLGGKGYGNIQFNAFYTYFSNKIIADYDQDPELVVYDNLKGYGISKGIAFNGEFAFTSGLKAFIGGTLMEVYRVESNELKINQIQTPNFTGNYAISYGFEKVSLSFDLTGNVYSPMRLPVVREYGDTRPEYSPWFGIHNIQATKRFKNGLQIYGGLKNFTNFLPKYPIFRADAPFSEQFDPSYNYAPMQRLRGFIGARINIF
ncbi:TonB-dependent receptor [Emticicia sp. BO119]|uniref:TonB-dependent receptor n=1 Tax=Emticicia sp. BO119 TaxID=2757768 RepID=UPI0015F09306|nr:TonB-dependent receptor [Emticicia sp. BO119]MBA4848843.1 TonB-dependent receptor [Emticicia sp. BO119]